MREESLRKRRSRYNARNVEFVRWDDFFRELISLITQQNKPNIHPLYNFEIFVSLSFIFAHTALLYVYTCIRFAFLWESLIISRIRTRPFHIRVQRRRRNRSVVEKGERTHSASTREELDNCERLNFEPRVYFTWLYGNRWNSALFTIPLVLTSSRDYKCSMPIRYYCRLVE